VRRCVPPLLERDQQRVPAALGCRGPRERPSGQRAGRRGRRRLEHPALHRPLGSDRRRAGAVVERKRRVRGSPEPSVIPPAIGNRQGSTWCMVGWSRPTDGGRMRTTIGNGSPGSWSCSVVPNGNLNCRSPAIARRDYDGRWLMVWRDTHSGDAGRHILVQDNIQNTWRSVSRFEANVDAWSAPTVAYHEERDRYIVGWVHSGVVDFISALRFARVRTRPATTPAAAWSAAVEVWADENVGPNGETGYVVGSRQTADSGFGYRGESARYNDPVHKRRGAGTTTPSLRPRERQAHNRASSA